MKTHLVAIGLFCFLLQGATYSVALAGGDSATSSNDKNDIQGLSPGMGMNEVKTLLHNRGWYCRDPSLRGYALSCETPIGGLVLAFASALADHPVISVRQFFISAENSAAVTDAVSHQYGGTPEPVFNDGRERIGSRWRLRDGLVLILSFNVTIEDYMLNLLSETLDRKNNDAVADASMRQHPTPRF
jgi:hypothetical protein